MAIDNDTRGWIMTAISGVACVMGASVICVDIVVRRFPGMERFSIAESNGFLSASLSLSFGVMLYSALNSMLPQSQSYLRDGGYSPKAAAWIQIGLFLSGVLGIRILSKVIHNFIPSHVVDCDHTHDEEEGKHKHEDMVERGRSGRQENGSIPVRIVEPSDSDSGEVTPLLSRSSTAPPGSFRSASQTESYNTAPASRKPSLLPRTLTRTFSKYVSSQKDECDETGPCLGYSDPCGNHCFKAVQRRTSHGASHSVSFHKPPTRQKIPSEYRFAPPVPEREDEEDHQSGSHTSNQLLHRTDTEDQTPKKGPRSRSATHHYHHPEGEHEHSDHIRQERQPSTHSHHHSTQTDHHHHVPTNAFMAIGLQTSLAIALHKAPEGFITYATNHANPTLGFAVFMALFIHNISEGFAMALPLYLALNSRWKAVIWSSILGGVSQPLGAGIAALWFKIAKHSGHMSPNEAIYGGMFAVTAGVMASVALSLFSESLQLSHNKNTCIAFAFMGMVILGVSHALTAK